MNHPPTQAQTWNQRNTIFALAGCAALLMTAFIARFLLDAGLTWRCPSMVLFALPCPSCGTTRALAALAHLDVLSAFRFNPLIVLVPLALALAPMLKLSWAKLERSRAAWLLLAVLGLNWLYLLFFLPR